MISVEEARRRILECFFPLKGEKVSILDALGRILAEDIYARRTLPPLDNSAMDGFALRSEDTVGASEDHPVSLEIVEEIPAGSMPRKNLGKGQAARIMTGAPLPEGADAVLRKEEVEERGGRILVCRPVRAGQDIRRAGEDVREGSLVISRGTLVRPAEIAMCAAVGRSFVFVHQRPEVAIIATGNELSEIDEEVSPGRIVNSNSYALAAQVKACGAIPVMMGVVRDDREAMRETFLAATRADVIVSSGGVSMGEYDLVKDLMQEMGNEMHFWRVAMRPGRPVAFGFIKGVPLFGLPGNPVSSAVSFEQFVRPALLKMMGFKRLLRPTCQVFLEEEIEKSEGFTFFLRGILTEKDGEKWVRTTGGQGSGIISSLVKANVLIVLPEEKKVVKKGEKVTVQLIDDNSFTLS